MERWQSCQQSIRWGSNGSDWIWLITCTGLATTYTCLTLPLLGKRVDSEGRLSWLLATLKDGGPEVSIGVYEWSNQRILAGPWEEMAFVHGGEKWWHDTLVLCVELAMCYNWWDMVAETVSISVQWMEDQRMWSPNVHKYGPGQPQ